MTNNELRNAIRNRYAWPGGYPTYGVTDDGAALCIDCMRQEYRLIARARRLKLRDGWQVVGVDINWEDTSLTCDHCNNTIESAYGEDH